MDRLLGAYAPRAKAAKTPHEFSATLNAMIREFGDSHFAYFTPDDQGYYLMDSLSRPKEPEEMPHVGAWFRPGPDGYTVQMVTEGGGGAEGGASKGRPGPPQGSEPFSPIGSLRGSEKVQRAPSRPKLDDAGDDGPQGARRGDVPRRDPGECPHHRAERAQVRLLPPLDAGFRGVQERSPRRGARQALRDRWIHPRPARRLRRSSRRVRRPLLPARHHARVGLRRAEPPPALRLRQAAGGLDQRGLAQRQGGPRLHLQEERPRHPRRLAHGGPFWARRPCA